MERDLSEALRVFQVERDAACGRLGVLLLGYVL
jgi:hypothetical protein